MDSVLNRPMFRRREARDRLNEMAGVQGYQAGGPVFETAGRQPVRPAGLPSMLDRLRSSGAMAFPMLMPMAAAAQAPETIEQRLPEVMQGLNESLSNPDLSPNDRRALEEQRAALSMALEGGRGVAEAVTDAAALLTRVQGQFLRGASPLISAVSPELGSKYLEYTDVFDRAGDTLATAVPEELPANLRPAGVQRPLESALSARGGARPEGPAAGMPADRAMPRPAGIGGARPEGPAAGMPAVEATAPAPGTPALGPAFERTGRGRGPLITNPAEVAAGLNAPDPAVREKTAADFMQEYMANAPKYEGADKKLMHAMIGFAIAAGDSPNAMTNIANGLLAGSEMMMKDKAEKAAFDRQIQLNAMQYGLEGVAKEREKGRPELQFTAVKDMVWKGRRVKEGQPVYLSYNDIENAGGVVPDGLLDAATYTGLIEKQAGVREALQEQYDRGLIDDAELRQNMNDYTAAATNVARSQRALDYFERALFKIGKDGTLTGIPGSFQKLVGKMGAAAGFSTSELDALANSGDAAEMEELLLRGVMDTVPSVVEGQSANSISDTDVRLAVRRLVSLATEQGSFSSLFTSEDTVIRQVQDAMNLIAGNRQRAFSAMSAIEGRLTNRVTKAGDFYNPAYASDLLVPLRESAGLSAQPDGLSSYGDMVLQEDGSYKLIFPEG